MVDSAPVDIVSVLLYEFSVLNGSLLYERDPSILRCEVGSRVCQS